ncbi:ABC transporter substrate-binding protein [Microbacterium sp. 18062]|uniref:ABC transporter substrate-binding protein n=1 Tax=Microbacterium sp. 18062 TaxID=2681410 RepID=UPI00135A66EC|nr:ABC transporter substrate-binding protein [Microbacterium sp. 18062]
MPLTQIHSSTAAHLDHRPARGRRRLTRLAVAAVAALALAGCATQPAGSSSAADGDLEPFTFLSYLTLDSLSMAPEMFADAHGLFEAQGLDVTLQPVKGSPVAMQGVLGGIAPLTRVGGIDLLTAAADGQPLVNVGTLVRQPGIRIISSDTDPLETAEDFVDKTVGVPSEGGTSDKTITLSLSGAGVDPASVGRQVVGLTPATFALVQQGQLAGYVVSIDTAEIVKSQNADAISLNPGDLSPSKADTQIYVTTPEHIETHGESISKYLAAIEEAVQFIVDDEVNGFGNVIEILRSKYDFATLNDDAIAEAALAQFVEGWTDGGANTDLLTTDETDWVAGYEQMVAAEMIPGGEDAASWMTNELLPAR